jgi:broad specificity phosphatase PhoE
MKTLEVRRHSLRKDGAGSQLSQAGVDLARQLGASMGPFARVVASVVPRARETALAMGFAVDQELVTMATDEGVYAEFETSRWAEEEAPLAALARLVAQRGAAWLYAQRLAAHWRDILMPLQEGEAALLIAHSGDIESVLVVLFPEADHAAWGKPFDCCEGARLAFDGEPPRFTSVEILRLQPSPHAQRGQRAE